MVTIDIIGNKVFYPPLPLPRGDTHPRPSQEGIDTSLFLSRGTFNRRTECGEVA